MKKEIIEYVRKNFENDNYNVIINVFKKDKTNIIIGKIELYITESNVRIIAPNNSISLDSKILLADLTFLKIFSDFYNENERNFNSKYLK